MYKRYLEPDDDSPLSKYMLKKVKIGPSNLNCKDSSRENTTSNSSIEVIQDNIEIEIEAGGNEKNHRESNDNDEFFRGITDQLIHPNLNCKTADAIVMILAYFLEHHLTWVALEDLLKLFHNVLGDDSNLPKTKYFFKKCFGQEQQSIFHFYCKECMVYIGTYNNLKSRQDEENKQHDERCDECTVCGTAYSFKKMNNGHFFIEIPLRQQILKKISENADILNYNTKSNSSDITDIFDGELYQKLRAKVGPGPLITLTLNTDGIRVFKSKRKASLWPIQMFINEVPPEKRLKQENIILNGIWFGKDPVFEVYLKPLIAEMKDLEENKISAKINNVDDTVTVRILLVSADCPAKCKVLKLKQYNGEFGCTYCLHPGFMVGASTTSKYILSSEVYRLRTHSSTAALMKSCLSTGKEILGVMGVSPLIGFKDYDLISGTIIDYLHCILEGVCSLQLDLWFDSKNHREKYYITPRGTELVNKNIKSIKPLKTFSISPRTIGEREFWKAHEFKYWLFYYAVPCLSGTLKPIYLAHLTLLSEAIFIFLKSRITPADNLKATENLRKFVDDFQKYYGEENMMYNVHLLEHLPKCVKECGPLWAYSNFNFESNNGSLVKHVNGTTDVEQQIATKYAFNNTLARLKKVSGPTFNYIDRMKNMRVKKSEKIGHITLFGNPHKHKLQPNEKNFFEGNSEYVMAYYKFFYENDVYFSSTYKRAELTDDSVVLLKDKRIGRINLVFKIGTTVSLLLKIFHVEQVHQFPEHIKMISRNTADKFEIVLAENVLKKLIFIKTSKESYVSELPNQYEVIELKYHKGKILIARKDWLLKQQQYYNKVEDVFCYWSPDLNDSVEDITAEYSQNFTGEPALFKVFVIKLADTLEEAEKVFQGRVTTVAKRFREPGNTDEEVKQMQAKRKRTEKKDLKAKQAQAHTMNIKYLVDEMKFHAPSSTSTSEATNVSCGNDINEAEVVPINMINEIEFTEKAISEKDEDNAEQILSSNVPQSTTQPPSTVNFLPVEHYSSTVIPPSASTHEIFSTDPRSSAEVQLPSYVVPSTKQSAVHTISEDPRSSTSTEISFDLASLGIPYDDILKDLFADGLSLQIDPNMLQQSKTSDIGSKITEITTKPTLEARNVPTNEIIVCNKEPEIIVNYDEVINKNKELTLENEELRTDNQNLKVELEISNKRNLALQNYLVTVDERVPETLYKDKEGGRLYRGGVFLSKKQCLVLENSNSDSEYINNLLVGIFGTNILKSHSLTGRPSNKTKGPAKPALDKERVKLIYDIMDARSVANKTKKLTETQKNAIVGKKLANVAGYKPKKMT